MNFYIIRRTINIARNNITSKISQKQGNKNEFETINPPCLLNLEGLSLDNKYEFLIHIAVSNITLQNIRFKLKRF